MFSSHGTDCHSPVPLIVIFTKFDGLVTKAFQHLRADGKNIRTANAGKAELAQRMLATNYRDPLDNVTFKPSAYVQLDGGSAPNISLILLIVLVDMRQEHSSCTELINQTANTLTDDALLLLFVSVQRNNLDLCVRLALV